MTDPELLASAKTHVRCGTPDCDWGTPLSNFSEPEVSRCRRQFREHCIERHGGYSFGYAHDGVGSEQKQSRSAPRVLATWLRVRYNGARESEAGQVFL
jgi:hypothetical protein